MNRAAHPASLFDRWTLLTLVGVAAFMIWGASRYTVFDDEAWSCRLYALPMGEMLGELWRGADPDPPLFYVLQNLWVHLFGFGPLALRTQPILFFLAGLVAMRAAGRAWFGPRAGLVTLLICVLHPAHLFFGFAARWYSLMFITVALLLWATAALITDSPDRPDRERGASRFKPIALWAVAAAAVCYTNYFGLVVVGLTWIAALLAQPRAAEGRRRFMLSLLLALVLAAAWVPPLLAQLATFDRPPATLRAFAATAARTGAALLTGNLAAPSAWWVWLPAGVFLIAFVVLLLREWSAVRPIALVVLGCLAAGVASRTMIDKYVMTFSGPACLLVAALTASSTRRIAEATPAAASKRHNVKTADPPVARPNPQSPLLESSGTRANNRQIAKSPHHQILPLASRTWIPIQWALIGALAAAWLGCGVNLLRERHWSSLRWLDPFEQVTAELLQVSTQQSAVSSQRDRLIVASHPAARYYFALHAARAGNLGDATLSTNPRDDEAERWREAFEAQTSDGSASPVATPAAAVSRLRRAMDATDPAQRSPRIDVTTLETSGYVDLPDWQALLELLQMQASMVKEMKYGEDPHAEWKDWLDRAVRHPSHRIIVRRWRIGLPDAPDPAAPIP